MGKKILFVIPSFGIGGTTISTRNMVSLLQKDRYDCWVMPLRPQGETKELYDGVNLIDPPFAIRAFAASGWKDLPTLMGKIGAAILRFLLNHKVVSESKKVGTALNKVIRKHHFETIVAGQEDYATRYVSYADCPNKVAWIRCDYKSHFQNIHFQKESFYQRFNSIVCVANQSCENFKSIYPDLAVKAHCIPNPQDSELIRLRADIEEDEPRFKKAGKTIVSIGRLDEVKRFDHIALIARRLIDEGIQFRWYLIGDGNERQHIAESIQKYGVEENVIMLGLKTNPYYYIKQSDVLVSLSRSEGCPRVINEAKILHIPTVSTDYPTIFEFIENGKTGIIASLEDIPSAIINLFSNERLYNHIKLNIGQFEFDNSELMKKLKTIL